MKKIIYNVTILLLVFTAKVGFAQNIGDLNGIYYQAVAIDDEGKEIVGVDISGKPLYERTIGVRFTITKGLNGNILWEETHETLTNNYGLFSLIIGHGEPTGNGMYSTMLEIPWIDANQFLKVEIAINNNGNYKLVSNRALLAVPYSFYADDIADDAITTEKILNETILAEDIAEGAVTSSEILNETILTEDIAESAVTTTEILDETILAEDIAEGAVTSSKILNETILAEDIAADAVTSSKVLNGTILNEDFQANTINLVDKVSDSLSVINGGTGLGTVAATDILMGNGSNGLEAAPVVDSVMLVSNANGKAELFKLMPGLRASIEVDHVNKIVYYHAVDQSGSGPDIGGGSVNTGKIVAGGTTVRNFPAEVVLGDIIFVTADVDLQGITMTAIVRQDGQVHVLLFNGTGADLNLGTVNFKLANFGQ